MESAKTECAAFYNTTAVLVHAYRIFGTMHGSVLELKRRFCAERAFYSSVDKSDKAIKGLCVSTRVSALRVYGCSNRTEEAQRFIALRNFFFLLSRRFS